MATENMNVVPLPVSDDLYDMPEDGSAELLVWLTAHMRRDNQIIGPSKKAFQDAAEALLQAIWDRKHFWQEVLGGEPVERASSRRVGEVPTSTARPQSPHVTCRARVLVARRVESVNACQKGRATLIFKGA